MGKKRWINRCPTNLAGEMTGGVKWGNSRLLMRGLAAGLGLAASTISAQTIVDEWSAVRAPPAPDLKVVNIDSKTTALLMLDFVTPNCTQRPRCMASVPAVKKLLGEARAKGMMIAYSIGPTGKRADTLPELAPTDNEPLVSTGVDKFFNTDLEKLLKDKGVQSVIVVGTAANGAVLYTASAAALRGMKVIVPVDGMSDNSPYNEQYTAWHLANVPVVSPNVTLTKFDLIKF